MGAARKITIQLPSDLLRKAQRSTGEGVTATIRRGLELVAAERAQEELRRLRGKVTFSIDWKKLRADPRGIGNVPVRSVRSWLLRGARHRSPTRWSRKAASTTAFA
jgi:hypothetical protein